MSEWIYPPEPKPEGCIGFTYIIINEKTFKCYPGLKTFVRGWEEYYGSNKELKAEIDEYKARGEEPPYTRGIIRWHTDRKELDGHEKNILVALDVTHTTFEDGTKMFYNKCANFPYMGGWNKGLKGVQVAWNKGGSNKPPTQKELDYRASMKGRPAHNKGKPSPQKGVKKGPRTPEHQQHLSAALQGKKAWNKGKSQPLTPAVIAAFAARKGKPWSQARRDAYEKTKL